MAERDKLTFKGGATRSLAEEFDARKQYQNYSGFQDYKTIDTLFTKKNYGILDKNFYPVMAIVDSETSNLENFQDYASSVYVLRFVAQAFKDFREDYINFIENESNQVERASRAGLIQSNDIFGLLTYPKYIDNVIPRLGYLNFENQYRDYINLRIGEYAAAMNRSTFGYFNRADFRSLASAFFKVMQTGHKSRINGRLFPVTRSGFSTSPHCSIMTTGLCIELAELEYSSDEVKGEIVTESAFKCFADFANYYGFFIDKNVPWRLIADLNSPKMKEYMSRSISLPENLDAHDYYYSSLVEKTHLDDWFYLRKFLTRLYLIFNGDQALEELLAGGQNNIYNDQNFLIEINLTARFLELGIPLSASYEQTYRKILDILSLPSYPGGTFRAATNEIGLVSSNKLKQIYGS
jgi:hypothetical protein|tara:strand:+ start:22301 stop:23524 length:1224 start_codon:yes stop_codon:yes gene_type:complete